MKNFVLGLILIFSLSFTTQTQAISIDHEKPNITIIDHFDLSVMQIAEDITFQIGNYQDSQGLDLFDFASGRHITSITSIGHSEDISITKGVDFSTHFNKEQSSNSKFTESWRPDRSIMYLRRAEAGSTNLQGNYYHSEGDHYRTKGNHYDFTKPNERFSKDLLLDRNWNGITNSRVCSIPIGSSKIKVTNPIPSGWYRNVTLT